MSDEEDDYLSDKFLLEAPPTSAPKTYSQLRKAAAQESAIKNEQNRRKGRRQIEQETRKEALEKSLFEREEEDKALGLSSGSKALSMMMKMGFKPGQALGQQDDKPSDDVGSGTVKTPSPGEDTPPSQGIAGKTTSQHIKAPIAIHEWSGKKEAGIGVRKRPPSPMSQQLVAKMTKMAETKDQTSFRDRARGEYLERQATGRLAAAQRTCVSLDEKAGKSFNVLHLNPEDDQTFPPGLLDALLVASNPSNPIAATTKRTPIVEIRRVDSIHSRSPHSQGNSLQSDDKDNTASGRYPTSANATGGAISTKSMENRLRQQMREDALQPIDSEFLGTGSDSEGADEDVAGMKDSEAPPDFTPGQVEEAYQFLRLNAQDRLTLVLSYLRNRYLYCFWCGAQFKSEDEMGTECPGDSEEDHD